MSDEKYTQYMMTTEFVIDRSPLQVDGVEIITRKEQEAIERLVHRWHQSLQAEIERAILYGDAPPQVALPKPLT